MGAQCDLAHWRDEAETRERRLNELRQTRELQRTLRAVEASCEGESPSVVQALHAQALQATRRLAQLEDELGFLRTDEAAVSAARARCRVDASAGRCALQKQQSADTHTHSWERASQEVEELTSAQTALDSEHEQLRKDTLLVKSGAERVQAC